MDEFVWKFREPDAGAVAAIATALGVPTLMAAVLVNRGITGPDEAEAFLNPRLDRLHDPFLLPDMEKAVDRLSRALDNGETIFLHGDYDVDGMTSTALCYRVLSGLAQRTVEKIGIEATVIPHIPRRSDGYDLQVSGVETAYAAGASLLLTVDCGTKAIPAVQRANELGMDVIISDHHRPGSELPPAYAIVNPYREDATVPFPMLAGVGIAFKLMDALILRRLPDTRQAFHNYYLDLVALGTVADITPLVGENRILVTHGLRSLAKTKRRGLRALLDALQLQGKTLMSDDIGWKIGPHLNAPGRVELAELSFRLLIASTDDEAEKLAVQLGEMREFVREETARVTAEALEVAFSEEQSGRRVLVLARERWAKGLMGLVANRIVESCRRPVFLLAHDAEQGVYVGSARARGDLPLHLALEECREFLVRYGGHSASAGMMLKAEHFTAFCERIEQVAADYVPETPEPPTLEIDAEIHEGRELTFRLAEWLERLEPLGQQNPEPVFATRGAVVTHARACGKDNATLQVSVVLPGNTLATKCVWFRNGEWAQQLQYGQEIDIAYRPQINVWNNQASVQLSLRDIKAR